MDTTDYTAFVALFSAYKKLWVESKVYKLTHDHPELDPGEVFEECQEEAVGVFGPISDALISGKPLQDVVLEVLQKA